MNGFGRGSIRVHGDGEQVSERRKWPRRIEDDAEDKPTLFKRESTVRFSVCSPAYSLPRVAPCGVRSRQT